MNVELMEAQDIELGHCTTGARSRSMPIAEQITALAHAGWTFGRIATVLGISVHQVVGITSNSYAANQEE